MTKKNYPQVQSTPYSYNIKVIGTIENAVTWTTGTFVPGTELAPVYSLGEIDNGAISTLAVKATNPTGRLLQFKLKEGSYPNTPGQYNLLPQGLELLSSGNIAGRVSFNTFTFDGGTTTFDKSVTTRLISAETVFDKNFDFTVVAYSTDGLVSVSRTFRIIIDRAYNSPYNGIYIKAMPDQTDRSFVNSLVQNTDIIEPSRVYRNDDPYFGISQNVIYNHAFSLDTATLDEYVNALTKNHFRKKLILGEIKTAQALNTDGTVEYEVVYSEVVDTGVNKLGESPPQQLTLPYQATVLDQEATDFVEFFNTNFSNGSLGAENVTALDQKDFAWLNEMRDLNLLANVGSQMARDWVVDGQPGDPAERFDSKTSKYYANPKINDAFNWTPTNQCPVNMDIEEQFRYDKFKAALLALTNDDLIYCDYTVTIDKDPNGNKLVPPKVVRSIAPFGFLIEVGDTAYLVMRGTQNEYDGKLDVMAGQVINPIAGFGKGKTHNGFTIAYKGLGPKGEERPADVPGTSLFDALKNTTKTKIRIGGHSLGSAISTLITNYAQTFDKFDEIEGYVSASPTVGNKKYAEYFNALSDRSGNTLGDNFYRLTNKSDIVPMVPGTWGGFTAVAQEVLF